MPIGLDGKGQREKERRKGSTEYSYTAYIGYIARREGVGELSMSSKENCEKNIEMFGLRDELNRDLPFIKEKK